MPSPRKPRARLLPDAPKTGRRSYLFRTLYVPSIKDRDVIEYLFRLRADGGNVTQAITDALREQMKTQK